MSGCVSDDSQSCLRRNRMVKHCSTVEISVSARKLRDVDFFSKSDPICILHVRQNDGPWREFGRTEPIMNNLDPDFVKKFNIEYYFEQKQYLKFEIFDVDETKKEKIKLSDFLGQYECTLGQLVSCLKIESPLLDKEARKPGKKKTKGTIIVVAEKQSQESREEISMSISAENLENPKAFCKASPYLKFSKESDDGGFTVVHRTETVKKELSPKWEYCALSVQALCNCELDRNLRIECFDDRNGDDKLIGECTTTLEKLRASKPPISFDLINVKRKEKKSDSCSQSGKLVISNMTFEHQHSFFDYIHGGTQIKVTMGIDFTQSNGPPSSPKSLHYCSHEEGQYNQYARAIQSVGEILEDYDSDKKIPAFCFGAKDPKTKEVMDLCPLNGDQSNPDCNGMRGIFEYYHDRLNSMELFGPSNFAPLINHVSRQAAEKTDGSEYHILLILTDGIIDDMAETKKEIVKATKLPMSIIIIGIGNGAEDEFAAMKILDSDDKPLVYRRDASARDIVQFVAFRDFDTRSMGSEKVRNHDCLTKEVLREVPEQLISYMRSKQIPPGRSTRASTLV